MDIKSFCGTMESAIPTKKALTGAERIKRYREKKSISDLSFRSNESQRVEGVRKMRLQTFSEVERRRHRENVAARQRKSRTLKKQKLMESNVQTNTQSPISSSSSSGEPTPTRSNDVNKRKYKTPQSLGKAVRRASRSLPISPNKRLQVVEGIFQKFGCGVKHKKSEQPVEVTGMPNEHADDKIKAFFFRSDIVYTMPGMKDEMVVWADGIKSRLRKYYLTMFLREAYELYCTANEETSCVSFSKFCSLRPQNVLLLKDSPVDQCKCRHHENFRLMLIGLGVPYDTTFWEKILCDTSLGSTCWAGTCEVCQSGRLLTLEDEDPARPVVWHEWTTNDLNSRVIKVYREGCYAELKDLCLATLSTFQEHVRVKRIQATAFEKDKSGNNSRILQVDFAMAYSCEYQNEIQSALWSRASVQLYTAAVFVNDECHTYLICSDTKDKGKDTIYTFMVRLYEDILERCDDVKQNIIFSDGPSSEFKNKYMVKLMRVLSQKFACDFQWKYFATSHGKGVVDGIGGRAKSLVRLKTMSKRENVVVQSSLDFAKLAGELMKRTTVMHISQDEIDSQVQF